MPVRADFSVETGDSQLEALRSSDADRHHPVEDSDNDAAHTNELLQKAFVTTRRGGRQ